MFWGLIASMWVGNAMLVILNLPLIGIWIKLLTVPYRFLFPAITLFCCIGVYTLNNNTFDVYLTALFALIGTVLAIFQGLSISRPLKQLAWKADQIARGVL